MMKKILCLLTLSYMSTTCIADADLSPDAYDVLLKNKDEFIVHDGCNYPKSGLEQEKVKLGQAFYNIFDSFMTMHQDMLILKECSSQNEHGWQCSITFNDYYRETKEEGPSPYSIIFSVDTSLNLDHDLLLICM